jgi:hypothetical protein
MTSPVKGDRNPALGRHGRPCQGFLRSGGRPFRALPRPAINATAHPGLGTGLKQARPVPPTRGGVKRSPGLQVPPETEALTGRVS